MELNGCGKSSTTCWVRFSHFQGVIYTVVIRISSGNFFCSEIIIRTVESKREIALIMKQDRTAGTRKTTTLSRDIEHTLTQPPKAVFWMFFGRSRDCCSGRWMSRLADKFS